MSQKEIDGGNDSGNCNGETAKPAVYSLDAIIALQKALEDGIPEGLAETMYSSTTDVRGVSRAPVYESHLGLGFMLSRIARPLFAAINRVTQSSEHGSSAGTSW